MSESKLSAVKLFIEDKLSQTFNVNYIENADDSKIEIRIKNLDIDLLNKAHAFCGVKFSFAPDTEHEKLSLIIDSVSMDGDTATIKLRFYFE